MNQLNRNETHKTFTALAKLYQNGGGVILSVIIEAAQKNTRTICTCINIQIHYFMNTHIFNLLHFMSDMISFNYIQLYTRGSYLQVQ